MTYRVKIKLCAMLLLFEPIANAIAIANTLHWQRKKNIGVATCLWLITYFFVLTMF